MDIVNGEVSRKGEGKNDLGMYHKTAPLVPLVGRDLSVPKDPEQIAAENRQITERQIKVTRDMQVQLAQKAEEYLAPTKEEVQQETESVQAKAKAAGEETRKKYPTSEELQKIQVKDRVETEAAETGNKYPAFNRQDFIPDPKEETPQEPWYKKGLLKKLWW